MSAEIRAIGAYTLCGCGEAVATLAIDDELVCVDCHAEIMAAKYPPPPAPALLAQPPAGPTLAEMLEKLTESAE